MTFFQRYSWFAWVLLSLAAVLVLAGRIQRETRAGELELYCAKVYSGDWPDHLQVYAAFCREGKVRLPNAPRVQT